MNYCSISIERVFKLEVLGLLLIFLELEVWVVTLKINLIRVGNYWFYGYLCIKVRRMGNNMLISLHCMGRHI